LDEHSRQSASFLRPHPRPWHPHESADIPNGSHVWIATHTNGVYPEEELEPDSAGRETFMKEWETHAFGESGFSHLLLRVGASGERAIEQWKNTKQEAPPKGIPGMEVLDTVTLALRPAR